MYRYNAANTGYSPDESGPAEGGSVRWDFRGGEDTVYTTPAVVDGTVYVVGGNPGQYDEFNAEVLPIDAESGQQQWVYDPEVYWGTSPAVVDNTVYVGGEDLYALDATEASRQWTYSAKSFTAPTVADGTVYFTISVQYGDNKIQALDAATGEEVWEFKSEYLSFTPAVADGTVYGVGGDNLHAVDADSGDPLWRFELEQSANAAPAVAGNSVYISAENTLYAVNSESGTQQWTVSSDEQFGSPVLLNETVYVTGNKLLAYDAASGDQQWSFGTEDSAFATPIAVDGTLYMGGNRMRAVDAATGEQQWSFNNESVGFLNPTVVDDTIFVGSTDSTIYALS